MSKTRYAEQPVYDQEWIDQCKVICLAAGWHLIGTTKWDGQFLCHERSGKILKVEPDWPGEGSMWETALQTIIDRSYRS